MFQEQQRVEPVSQVRSVVIMFLANGRAVLIVVTGVDQEHFKNQMNKFIKAHGFNRGLCCNQFAAGSQ